MDLPPSGQSMQAILGCLNELVEDIGYRTAATITGVSVDTIRRRVRGTQPWAFSEVFDLARWEISQHGRGTVAHAMAQSLSPVDRVPAHPLQVPSNLREMLRLVGRLTVQIAETLEDGIVDRQEATDLLILLGDLEALTGGLRIDLAALAQDR